MNRNFIIIYLIFILQTPIIFGQLQNNNWVFGNGYRVNFSGLNPVVSNDAAILSYSTSASVSDPSTGQLLFYTDAKKVWDANNQVMQNGTNLLGGNNINYTQGAVIVPFTGDNQRYYVFTLDGVSIGSALSDDGLRYSIVDINLNGGLGDIEVATMNTQLATDLTEKLIVIRSSEIQGFWLIAHRRTTNEFLAWKIDACGISAQPVVSVVGSNFEIIGGFYNYYQGSIGAMAASPDGNRIGMPVDGTDRVEFFDFNKTTGVLSNPIIVNVTDVVFDPTYLIKHGACFSPDGSKFYYTNQNSVHQLNLSTYTSAAIASSNTEIYSSTVAPVGFACYQIERALNNKLYVSLYNYELHQERLDEISSPNSLGLGCGYINNAVSFSPSNDIFVEIGLPSQVPLGGFEANSTITFLPDSCLHSDFSFSIASSLPINQINWNFGDVNSGLNNTSTAINPIHQFSQLGSYQITAIVEFNCFKDTITQNITVFDCLEEADSLLPFEFPNVISPNNDNINDILEITNLPENTEVFILNRWGNKVFSSDNYQNNWQGNDNLGKELVDGVYTYYYKTKAGKTGHGFVYLVRNN